MTKQGLSCSFRFFSHCYIGHVFEFFLVSWCMLCLVRYLFVICTSVIDCLGRFVPEMTYYVWSGTLNFAKLKLKLSLVDVDTEFVSFWLLVYDRSINIY